MQIAGDFDDAMLRVQQVTQQLGIYLVNSVNPFRLEGQKTSAFEIVEVLEEAPDWLCIPMGNAGNITVSLEWNSKFDSAEPRPWYEFQSSFRASDFLNASIAS